MACSCYSEGGSSAGPLMSATVSKAGRPFSPLSLFSIWRLIFFFFLFQGVTFFPPFFFKWVGQRTDLHSLDSELSSWSYKGCDGKACRKMLHAGLYLLTVNGIKRWRGDDWWAFVYALNLPLLIFDQPSAADHLPWISQTTASCCLVQQSFTNVPGRFQLPPRTRRSSEHIDPLSSPAHPQGVESDVCSRVCLGTAGGFFTE